MKKIIKEKRAQIFVTFVVFGLLMLCGYTLFTFVVYNNRTIVTLSLPSALLKLYDNEKSFEFSSSEAARLALASTYYNFLNYEMFGKECKVSDGYVEIFDESCMLASDIKEKFEQQFNQTFNEIMKEKKADFDVSFDGNVVTLSTTIKDTLQPDVSAQGAFFPWSAKQEFKLRIALSLEEEGFQNFQQLFETIKNCKDKLPECEIKNFDISQKDNGFILSTKKAFLYKKDEKIMLEPISFGFLK